jgi:hypothetical protein
MSDKAVAEKTMLTAAYAERNLAKRIDWGEAGIRAHLTPSVRERGNPIHPTRLRGTARRQTSPCAMPRTPLRPRII